MIDALTPHFQKVFPGSELAIKLYPAVGYWRQTKADVMQFTGSVRLGGNDGMLFDIGCWESMTDCLRFGFEFYDERRSTRPDASFIVMALKRSFDRK